MVKFDAPEHTRGPLCGYTVTGTWTVEAREPQPRGDVGRQDYTYAHHYEPVTGSRPMDPVIALSMALSAWRDESHRRDPSRTVWRPPDRVEVAAVYSSQLSASAGSEPDDPFAGVEGSPTHDGYERSRRTRERGKVNP